MSANAHTLATIHMREPLNASQPEFIAYVAAVCDVALAAVIERIKRGESPYWSDEIGRFTTNGTNSGQRGSIVLGSHRSRSTAASTADHRRALQGRYRLI